MCAYGRSSRAHLAHLPHLPYQRRLSPEQSAHIEGAQPSQVGQVGQGGQLNTVGTQLNTPTSGGDTAIEVINKKLGLGGQHFETLNSDALQRWVEENQLEERDGTCWQRRQLPGV